MKRFLTIAVLGGLIGPLAGCSFSGSVDNPPRARASYTTERTAGDRVVRDEVRTDSNGNRYEKKTVEHY